jgi:hypothetical protein
MRTIGFSTGALARGDFHRALHLLDIHNIRIVEVSALRIRELEPLFIAFPNLDLGRFEFASIHAPSRFPQEAEDWVVERLAAIGRAGFPVVVHPDTIYTPDIWKRLGNRLVIENMDKRKPAGRTVSEMKTVFDNLPDARFCFDIGHARQVDPTMTEASLLLDAFRGRLEQVHISEVNTASRHDPISPNAVKAFQAVAMYIPEATPIILETLIDSGQSDIETEIARAREGLNARAFVGAQASALTR